MVKRKDETKATARGGWLVIFVCTGLAILVAAIIHFLNL